MDSIVANDGLVLGVYGDYGSIDLSPEEAYQVQAGYGLTGTHLSGTYNTFDGPWSPYVAKIDLATMKVSDIGKFEEDHCTRLK